MLALPEKATMGRASVTLTYKRVVERGFAKVEVLLKLVMEPHENVQKFVAAVKQTVPSMDARGFQRLLELKGIARMEQVTFLSAMSQL